MFMAVTISSIHGKNFQNSRNSIVNTTDLTKQMFEKSAKLVSEQEDLIFGDDWWENHSWKYVVNW